MVEYALSRLDVIIPLGAAVILWMIGLCLLVSPAASSESDDFRFYTAFLICIGVFISLSLFFYKYTVDDAYISLRYARNLANGYGLVFSTDGSLPVEGYTNFLWVLIETPLFLMNVPDNIILHAIKLIGIGFGVGCIIVTFLLIHLISANKHTGLLGVWFLSATPNFAFWAIGGLETTMYIFWMLLGLYCFLHEQSTGKLHITSMISFLFMALTRPEGLFFVLAFLVLEYELNLFNRYTVTASTKKQLLTGTFVFLVLYGAYFLWRFNFYGFLLPNTFYAKSGTPGIVQFIYRSIEMSPFIAYLLPFAAFAWLGSFQFHPIQSNEKKLLVTTLTLLLAFCFASKREWMPGYRYELPTVPILMIFASLGIHKMLFANSEKSSPGKKEWKLRLGVLFLLGVFLVYPARDLIGMRHYTDGSARAHIKLGKWLKQYAPKGSSYASWDMGAVPYFSELPSIIDIHPEAILNAYITHNGYDINYILSLKPDFLVLPPEPNSIKNICISQMAPPENGMYVFYSSNEFRKNYELQFSFALCKDYIISVYKYHKTEIHPDALDVIIRSAKQSFDEVYPDSI